MSKSSVKEALDTFKGRSYLMPAFLLLFILFYVFITVTSPAFKQADTMFWLTVVCYVVLAVLFTLRRPFLSVGRDYVRSRRFTGDRNIYVSNIKSITAQKGYVVIAQHKGGNWVFSRMINRFPTEQMAVRLKAFAEQHEIPFTEK